MGRNHRNNIGAIGAGALVCLGTAGLMVGNAAAAEDGWLGRSVGVQPAPTVDADVDERGGRHRARVRVGSTRASVRLAGTDSTVDVSGTPSADALTPVAPGAVEVKVPRRVTVTLPGYEGGTLPAVTPPRYHAGTAPTVERDGRQVVVDLGEPGTVTPPSVHRGQSGTLSPPGVVIE
jgi:hypothetical protein